MADLRTTLCGIDLRNPFVLASGPLSHNGEALLRAYRAGAGAVVTKTICEDATRNPVPHIARFSHGLLNGEQWSDLPARDWIEREIPLAKDGGATVIASLGLGLPHVKALAHQLADAGADALEICSYDAEEMGPMVAEAVRNVRIPVLAKISGNWSNAAATACECVASGAAGITAIDSIGPVLRFDIEKREPVLGSGVGWLSGAAILPISLRVVADIARSVQVPIVGTGGIRTEDECVEMLMAGAHAIGLCSVLMTEGLSVLDRLIISLEWRLADLGYSSAREVIGAGLAGLERLEASPRLSSPGRPNERLLVFAWDKKRCTECGICMSVCPYEARTEPDCVDFVTCRFCGLCTSSCPAGALSLQSANEESA
ncbi:4Fe-4S binding protein [Candidatus Bipolaricaulota bacterium]